MLLLWIFLGGQLISSTLWPQWSHHLLRYKIHSVCIQTVGGLRYEPCWVFNEQVGICVFLIKAVFSVCSYDLSLSLNQHTQLAWLSWTTVKIEELHN